MTDYQRFVEEAALDELALYRLERHSSEEVRHVYDVVRNGAARFGKPAAAVHADLWQEIEALRSTPRARWRALPRKAEIESYRFCAKWWSYLFAERLRQRYERDDAPRVEPRAPGGSPGTQPMVSIIMLSWNRREYLARSLRYFAQTIDYPAYELIVVDNGSTDGSVELLRRAVDEGVVTRLVLSPVNLGIARGYNVGFAHADPATEFWVKLDSDILVLSSGWLHEFVRIFREDERVGLLALHQVNHNMLNVLPTEQRCGTRLINWSYWCAGGSCMTVPRRTFDKLGFFCEGYDGLYTPDEGDYYQRMARLGLEGYFVKSLRAYHQIGLDTKDYLSAKKHRFAVEMPKLRASFAPMLARYDRGELPLRCDYEKYKRVSRQPVVELDATFAAVPVQSA